MDFHIEQFEKHSDERGDLVVFLKHGELPEDKKEFGQIYFVTFDSAGQIRGEHFHKEWREWFGVVAGKICVRMKDLKTGETAEVIINSSDSMYTRLETGPNVVHSFKSLTDYAAMINYADGEWHPNDTFPYELFVENWQEDDAA